MKLIIFTHPDFLGSQSMPRFARMLQEGMQGRGHSVELWTAAARAYHWPSPRAAKKWLGYLDQYLLFPSEVKRRLKSVPQDTLFIFADQALGPWVPLVADRPHVIHCHDFLAQRSALGELPENPTGCTGRIYQWYIRNGYQQGQNFISVSEKTRTDLQRFLKRKPQVSEVVYNGLNQDFKPRDITKARRELQERIGIDLTRGYLLHVGGNQWYKNRAGVISIIRAWQQSGGDLPCLMIGERPSAPLLKSQNRCIDPAKIHWLTEMEDHWVRVAYTGASAFLFPSLEEGFGWPIAEAMASGCPVMTTGEAPMTEVAGEAAYLIPRQTSDHESSIQWAHQSAGVLTNLLELSESGRERLVSNGISNAARFDTETALNRIESIYSHVMRRGHRSLTSGN
jgi:glycosyltransferase involved in cell wall biosynthesis